MTFLDPFAEIPTLTMHCSFFNKEGKNQMLHNGALSTTEPKGFYKNRGAPKIRNSILYVKAAFTISLASAWIWRRCASPLKLSA